MGLMDKLRGELIDIIEWLDDSRDTMVWRFPRYQNEIKMGAKLVVRESQTAVFVNEGRSPTSSHRGRTRWRPATCRSCPP
ncbi:SPFH domain-containing protein [Micromonospora sp. BRA006-A]|nr:SPFH domain-containing protein [Micromonospora sp. BRA006-A]